MADFWNSWQLWVKMTFVLACAIVLVVGAGICKLVWMSRNLRKHVRLLQERQAEQAALMARPSVRERKRRAEVPFGVRAIESGIEVEGVWISRPNSTATSLAQTPVLSGAASPVVSPSPQDRHRHGAETPVSGAARVLSNAGAHSRRSSRPGTSRANSSDPFRDSRAASSRQDSASSHSGSGGGGNTPYHDLPDAEAGLANVRMPSNPSLRSNSIRYSPNHPGWNAQPAFYRPTGTPDPHTRPRNSYIPKYLQTRALGEEGLNFVSSPEEDEDFDPATSYVQSKTDQASERGRLLPRGRSLETSFVTPAGMMPQVHGLPGPSGHNTRSSRGYRTSTQPQYRYADASPDEQHAPSYRDFADLDPHRLSRRPRSSRMPSHEEVDEQQQQREHAPPTNTPPALGKAKEPTSTTTPSQPRTPFATRADAEAANDDMRRVNDGFSVSRHGMRRNRESLIAEARELREDRERREREREGARRSYPQTQQPQTQQSQQQQIHQQQRPTATAGDRTRGKEADAADAAGGRRKLQKKRASSALYPGGTGDGAASAASGAREPMGQQGSELPAASSSRVERGSTRGQARRNSQFREQM